MENKEKLNNLIERSVGEKPKGGSLSKMLSKGILFNIAGGDKVEKELAFTIVDKFNNGEERFIYISSNDKKLKELWVNIRLNHLDDPVCYYEKNISLGQSNVGESVSMDYLLEEISNENTLLDNVSLIILDKYDNIDTFNNSDWDKLLIVLNEAFKFNNLIQVLIIESDLSKDNFFIKKLNAPNSVNNEIHKDSSGTVLIYRNGFIR